MSGTEADAAAQLAREIDETPGMLMVVTGAGLSLASGIPTFRGTDPGAVWKNDVTTLGTVHYFSEEPEGSWSWYLSRFSKLENAQPNAGHDALVALERHRAARGAPFLLVTQNVDGLHRKAGAEALVEVHGTADRVRCSGQGCAFGSPRGSLLRTDVDFSPFLAAPTRANVPLCPGCGEWLRPHVLWFDELYNGHDDYQWKRVREAAAAAARVIFIGTSLSVGATDQIRLEAQERQVPIANLDPAGRALPGITLIREPSEVFLPRLVSLLTTRGAP
jgi:NAD-dependent deacetylase